MSYLASPFNALATLLFPGQVGYSLGSYNDKIPTTQMSVTSSSESSGNVITLHVKVVSGPIPTTSQFVSTQSLTNVANQTNEAILSVTINAGTGIGTITFADVTSAGTIANAPDAGVVLAPQIAVAVALTDTLKGIQFTPGNYGGYNPNQKGLTWQTAFPSPPSTVTMVLQAAQVDQDSEYEDLDTSSNAAGELRYIQNVTFNFYRIICTATSGGSSPTVIATITF